MLCGLFCSFVVCGQGRTQHTEGALWSSRSVGGKHEAGRLAALSCQGTWEAFLCMCPLHGGWEIIMWDKRSGVRRCLEAGSIYENLIWLVMWWMHLHIETEGCTEMCTCTALIHAELRESIKLPLLLVAMTRLPTWLHGSLPGLLDVQAGACGSWFSCLKCSLF